MNLVLLLLVIVNFVLLPPLHIFPHLPIPLREKFVCGIILLLTLYSCLMAGVFLKWLPESTPWVLAAILTPLNALCWPVVRTSYLELKVHFRPYFLCSLWFFAAAFLIQIYSGASWSYDWHEHYLRAQFFLGNWPEQGFVITSRPPLINLISAFFMYFIGHDFYIYQFLMTALGTLSLIPIFFLFVPYVQERYHVKHFEQWILIACLFNPLILQNVTYSWTRAPTNFLILAALYFFWQGWRPRNLNKISVAFFTISVAVTAHYSAAPYLVVMAFSLLLMVLRSRSYRPLIALTAAAPILGTWIFWAFTHRGVSATLASNTTVEGLSGLSTVDIVVVMIGNIGATLIPHFLRYSSASYWDDQDIVTSIRDYLFLIYQTNLFGALGVGGNLVFWSQVLSRQRDRVKSKRTFQFGTRGEVQFITTCIIGGIVVHGTFDEFGVAHICLQPIVILGLLWVFSQLTEANVILKRFVAIGLIADLSLGVLLQVYVQYINQSPLNFELKQTFKHQFLYDYAGPNLLIAWIVFLSVGTYNIFKLVSLCRTEKERR